MSGRFVTTSELLALGCPALPPTERSLRRMAKSDWQRDPSKFRKREGAKREIEYHVSVLPHATQLRLEAANKDIEPTPDRDARWIAFDNAPATQKAIAQDRLKTLQAVLEEKSLTACGDTVAVQRIAEREGVSPASIRNWRKMVRGVDRADWLPALLPSYKATAKRADIHPEAWDYFVSDMLRPSEPTLTKAYRRLVKAAAQNKWSPIPEERSLRRRYQSEVPEAVKILARKGKKELRTMIPAQRRTVAGLHAMQAVNMDGHKFDVFVNWPGYDKPIRPVMIALQDIYSRKIVAWRVSDTENKETTALVIGDMVERWGIPHTLLTDNGRAFASKWITGGSKTRFRFKIKDSDPNGLLTSLGVTVAWAMPGHGQAKPIERAFGDFATDAIAKHPLCAGAYTGNSPLAKPEDYGTRAIDKDAFIALVDQEVAAHNARTGRRTEMARAEGLSFDAVFERSYKDAIITWPTTAQKALWLCAAERIRTQKGSGEIHFAGNRYWSQELNGFDNREVTIRFDPDNLHQPIRVYDTDDRLICIAALIEDAGFFSRTAARQQAQDVQRLNKTVAEQKKLIAKLKPEDLAEISLGDEPPANPMPAPRVKRLATGGAVALPTQAEETDVEPAYDSHAALERGLKVINGGLDD